MSFFFGPGFCRRKTRETNTSILSKKASYPKGRPIRSCKPSGKIVLQQSPANLPRRQEGLDLLFEFSLSEKDGKVSDKMLNKLRYQLTDRTEPHLLEKATVPHPRFNKGCPLNEDIHVPAGMSHIYDHPAMNRMMRNDVTGIG